MLGDMQRRTFLSSMAAGALTAAFPAPALCLGRTELRLAVSSHEYRWNVAFRAKWLAERIRKSSGDTIHIRIVDCDYNIPKQALHTGEADLALGIADCDGTEASAFYQLLNLPFGLDGNGLSAWIHSRNGQELWDKLSTRASLRSFLCGHSWQPTCVWLPVAFQSLGDLQGLSFSTLKAREQLWQQLGAVTVNDAPHVMGSERTALQGARQYCGLGETGIAFELTCAKHLPQHIQQILKVACEAEYREGIRPASKAVCGNILPRDIRIAAGNVTSITISKLRDTGDSLTQGALDSFQAARQKSRCGTGDVHAFDYLYL